MAEQTSSYGSGEEKIGSPILGYTAEQFDLEDTVGTIALEYKMLGETEGVVRGIIRDNESGDLITLASEQLLANLSQSLLQGNTLSSVVPTSITQVPDGPFLKDARRRIMAALPPIQTAHPEDTDIVHFLLSVNTAYKSFQFAAEFNHYNIQDTQSELSTLRAALALVRNLPQTLAAHAALRGETLDARALRDIKYVALHADDVGQYSTTAMRHFLSDPGQPRTKNALESTLEAHFGLTFPDQTYTRPPRKIS